MSKVPDDLLQNLFSKSCNVSNFGGIEVKGYDFNKGINYDELLKSYSTMGLQATNFAKAVDEINKMLDKKEETFSTNSQSDSSGRPSTACTIFLGYTSNVVSSGMRDIVRFLAEHNLVDCIVSTAGGIEEDLMKCIEPHLLGSFGFKGAEMKECGVCRIGNMVVTNDTYRALNEWITPILGQMVEEQDTNNFSWTPTKLIHRLGKEINKPESILYWCYKNSIPVHSPALTDGAMGDMFLCHSYGGKPLRLDIIEDVIKISNQVRESHSTGMILLGGGLVKHHIANANSMRDGADYSVYVNTGIEYDGSDAGASPDEAVSWGKIKTCCQPVKVYGETSLIFPLLVAQTFAKRVHK